jgi:redox-sensitive bicupin YhaK (pirin superfamily)
VPAHGKITIGTVTAQARDGVAIRDEPQLTITALDDSEVVLVDAA